MWTALILMAALAQVPQVAAPAPDPPPDTTPTVAEAVNGLERFDGLLTLHLDRDANTVLLELPPPGAGGEVGRYLYVESLRRGLGSNAIGLDRGQLGRSGVIRLRRLGPKVLIEQVNLDYRAVAEDPPQVRAVEESFATSVLWVGETVALDPDGRALVDFTSFVVRDAHGSAQRLGDDGEGGFSLDEKRSLLEPDAVLAFPDNIELEAILTFAAEKPGPQVRETAPWPEAVTLIQHHSLISLPDDGYQPRRFDPRVPSFPLRFVDFAAALDEPIVTRWITRHHLEKTDPAAPRSPVKKPIVYYVDRGAPEPVRSALMEGAAWWAEAFDAAGFVDAFRVELLPEDAHPLDVRYNVIQWVHRSGRGWSYGGGVTDPRTGQIIKGHVTLGSLRVRQDRMIFEALAGAGKTGSGRPDDPVQLGLARLRQLSAHEVGHTLGFAHNFAASTYGGRAFVMDYPAPLITVNRGDRLDFSDAYGVGVGTWDRHAVRYAYHQVPPGGDEEATLARIVADGIDRGLRFMSDADARPAGSAHPHAHLWDNGDDPVEGLRQAMAVRRVALDSFGEHCLREGRPLAELQELMVPVYLYHRYQLEAASKLIGGVDYAYAVVGDGQGGTRVVEPSWQKGALSAVLDCLEPAFLELPAETARLLVPPAFGDRGQERFGGATDPTFDPFAIAATAGDLAVRLLLEPHRCARLLGQKHRVPASLGLSEMLQRIEERVFDSGRLRSDFQSEIRRRLQQVTVHRMIGLAGDDRADPAVRGILDRHLDALAGRLESAPAESPRAQAHTRSLAQQIRRHLDRTITGAQQEQRIDPPPPGPPIGTRLDWGGCGSGL